MAYGMNRGVPGHAHCIEPPGSLLGARCVPPPGASGVLLCSYGNEDTYGMGMLSPLSPSSHDTAVHPSCRPGARIALLRVRVVTHHRLTSPLFIVGFVKIN